MDDTRELLGRLTRLLAWRRRLVAAGLAAAAVALAIEAASPPDPATTRVAVAARELGAGTDLSADDVTTAELPPGAVPDGVPSADDLVGRKLAGPVRAGEVITDARLVGERFLSGWGAGIVASPVRVADPGAAELLRPGDRIDLLATAVDGAGETALVAAGVPVLTLTEASDDVLSEGALLVVGTTADQAARLAGAAVTSRLTFTLVAS